MTQESGESPEFSRKLRLDKLAAGPVERALEAGGSERAALAARFGLVGLDRLTGKLRVSRPMDSPIVRVEGEFAARVTQTCVVTLEAFAAEVGEAFVQLYTLDPAAADEGEVFVAVDDDDTPEPLAGDALDLGEVLAEQLALALDPHPRAPGARFEGASFGSGPETPEAADNPFAVLRHLKSDG